MWNEAEARYCKVSESVLCKFAGALRNELRPSLPPVEGFLGSKDELLRVVMALGLNAMCSDETWPQEDPQNIPRNTNTRQKDNKLEQLLSFPDRTFKAFEQCSQRSSS